MKFIILFLIMLTQANALEIDLNKLNKSLKSHYEEVENSPKNSSKKLVNSFVAISLAKQCYSIYLIDKAKDKDSTVKREIMVKYSKFIRNFRKRETEEFKKLKKNLITKEIYDNRLNKTIKDLRKHCGEKY